MTLVRLFVFFGGLLAIALFAVLLGPYFIDWSVYRADFERESSRIIGQKVVVRGDAEFKLLPFPSVIFNDLAVGENKSGQPLMTAKRFEMDLEITPFLSGEILIFNMRIDEPAITVTLFEDGTLDWALNSEKNLAGRTLVLESVKVIDGQIKLIDLQNQRTKKLVNINALMSAPETSGPWRVDGSAELEDKRYLFGLDTGAINAKGEIRLRTRISSDEFPLFLETEGSAKIIDNKPSYNGNFSIQKLTDKNVLNTPSPYRSFLTMQMRGGFKINNESLDIPQYRLTSGNKKDPYVIEGKAQIDISSNPNFLISAEGQQFDFNNLLDDKDRAEGGVFGTGLSALDALIAQVPIIDFPGQIDLKLPAVVSGNTTVRDVVLAAKPVGNGWIIENLSAKLPGRTDIEIKGILELGDAQNFSGNLLIATQQPSGLSSWLIGRVDPAIRQLDVAGISASVLLNDEIQRLDNLELILGSSIIKGFAERQQIRNIKPSISVDLNGDELDLNKLQALLQMINFGRGVGSVGKIFDHNIIAQLDTKRMNFGRYTASDVKLISSWENGDLALDQVAFGDFSGISGTINGTIKNLNTAPQGALSFTMKSDRPDKIFKTLINISNNHPAVARLAQNHASFSNIDLTGEFSVKQDQVPQLKLEGNLGDSAIEIQANGQALLPQIFDNAASPLAISMTATNPESHQLFAQLGFQVLPFDFEEPGQLNLELSRGFDEDFDLDAKIRSGTTNIELDGFIDLPNQQNQSDPKGLFTIDVISDDIEPLLLTFGQNLPGLGSGQPLEFNAGMIIGQNNIQLNDIVGNADSNKFNGTISADRTGRTPNLEGELNLDSLDTEWLYELATGVPFFSISDTSWSQTPYLPPFEASPKTNLKITSKQLTLPSLPSLQNASARLITEPGNIAVRDLTGMWIGGEASGNLSISNPDGKAFVSLDTFVTGADIAQINWGDNQTPLLAGKIDIAGNLEGTGSTLRDVVGSMNGGGLYKLSQTSINPFNPNIIFDVFESADKDGFDLSSEAISVEIEKLISVGEFELKDVAIPFTVTGGIQRISSITVEDESFDITGAGRIDLVKKTVSSSIDILYNAGLEAQTGATPEITLEYEGALNAPVRSINATAMSNFLSIRAYERERRRVELLQASILEKQHLRREIALVKDQQLKREEQARLIAEEIARQKAEEEARLKAEQDAILAAEKEAQRITDEAVKNATKPIRQPISTPNKAPAIDWQKSVEQLLKPLPKRLDGGILVLPLDAPVDQ